MKENFYLPQEIIDAYNNKKLVIFIGAGISRLMGCQGWDDLSDRLIKKLYNYADSKQIIESGLKAKDKITIAYEKASKDNNADVFWDLMKNALKPNDDAKDIYGEIVKFNCIFVTTNADGLLENHGLSQRATTECTAESVDENGYPYLYYVHGRIGEGNSNDLETLVFTAGQYLKKYNNKEYIDFLRKLFNGYTVLFLGYGLNEFELLDHIISKGKENECFKRHYILEGFCSQFEALMEAKESYYNSLGITLLKYCQDEKGYDRQYDIIVNWVSQIYTHTYNLSNTINDIKTIAATFNEVNKTNLRRILVDLDSTNKVFLKEFLKELKKSKYYFEYLQFLWNDNIVEIKEVPKIIKTEYGFSSPYWMFLQSLFEILRMHRTDDKLQKFSRKIVKETISYISDNKDLFDNYNVKRNIINIVLLLNDKNVSKSLIESILKFDKEYHDIDLIGSEICSSDYYWISWNDNKVIQVLQYVFSLRNEQKGIYGNVHDFYFESIFNRVKEDMNASIKQRLATHMTGQIFDAIKTERRYYGKSFDTQFVYNNVIVKSLHTILKNLLSEIKIEDSVIKPFIKKANTEITVQFVLNMCLLNDCSVNILTEFENNPLIFDNVLCDYYKFLKSKAYLDDNESKIVSEHIKTATFRFDKDDTEQLKYITTNKLELLSMLKDKNKIFMGFYKKELKKDHYELHDPEQSAIESIPTVSKYNPLDYFDKSSIEGKTIGEAFEIASENLDLRHMFFKRDIFEYIIDQKLLEYDVNRIFSCIEDNWDKEYRFVVISLLNSEKYSKYFVFESSVEKIQAITNKMSSITISENEVVFIKNIISILEKFYNNNVNNEKLFELCLYIDKQGLFGDNPMVNAFSFETETYNFMINDGESKLYMLMFNIITDLKKADCFEKLFAEFKSMTNSKIESNNIVFLCSLYLNMQNCFYIKSDWADSVFEKTPDKSYLDKLLGLACFGANYVFDKLINTMTENIEILFSSQEKNKQLRNSMIGYFVSSYMFKKIEETEYLRFLNEITENDYFAVLNTILNQNNENIGISQAEAFKRSFEIMSNQITDDEIYVTIIYKANQLPKIDDEIWKLITMCLEKIKDKKTHVYIDDIFGEHNCSSEAYFECFSVYIKYYLISDFDVFKNVIKKLVEAEKKDKARQLCNTLIQNGVYIDETNNLLTQIQGKSE